jgi:C-terminal processing protease CtpA/Prc
MKKRTLRITFVLFALISAFAACDKDPITPDNEEPVVEEPVVPEAPELTQKINTFIKDGMEDAYLWYNELPDIDVRYEFDSKEYFDKLLFTEDKWSFIVDDIDALQNSLQGIEKSYGWSLAFGKFSNTDNLFAVVEFVYPNTPAAEAGMKRGDIIVEMFNSGITEENYLDLLNSESLTITRGIIGDGSISNGSTVNLLARELNLDPVVFTNIIEHNTHKIGYLFYAQYITEYNTSLDNAFQYFKDEQITDLVLDLRYNPGGRSDAAVHLCSSLAPGNVVSNNDILVTFQWSDKYQALWESENMLDQIQIKFSDTVSQKMDLNKLHILTGRGTASASELTITGLKPYMNVTTIGETTYGKYTGSYTLKPENYYDPSYYSEFDNWGIQPIVFRYANSQGITDFANGFSPDIPVEDNLFDALPLGQKEEPLLKAAIVDITGIPVLSMKKVTKKIDYTLFDRGFSKYDANKRELLIDYFDGSLLK